MELRYRPPKTVAAFLRSNARMRVIKGPIGSGKSSGCVVETLRRSIEQEPDNDAVRRSAWVIVRNTMPMLKDTTIRTFLDWFPHGTLGTWHTTDKVYKFRFNDVESDVYFRALDDRDDVAKLLSAEYTGCYFNEFREIDQSIYETMRKRIGRYPSRKNGPGPSWYGVWADTNPPVLDTWHHNMMEKEPGFDNDWDVFHQPSGRSAEAENVENLPSDYYDTAGYSEEFIRVMIDGEYGTSQYGLPVFASTFKPTVHMAKSVITPIRSGEYPLYAGVDAGLTPAAVIGQRDHRGRLLIIDECVVPKDTTMGMDRFMSTMFMPFVRERYPNATIRMVLDPASSHRAQANEMTVWSIVQRHFPATLAPTNKLNLRVSASEKALSLMVDGSAGLQISPLCVNLKRSLSTGYRWKIDRDGTSKLEIQKNHDSHVGDAFGYFCVHFFGGEADVSGAARKVIPVPARGWT